MDFRKESVDGRNKPAELIKGGFLMILNGIKVSIRSIKLSGFSLNVGFIGLNVAGSSS